VIPITTVIPQVGYGHLFANAMAALMLDITTLLLLNVISGIFVCLAGAFKVKIALHVN
jgi:hypothetical protein